MTLDEFLARLESDAGDGWFVAGGGIRRRTYGKKILAVECPVCALHPTLGLGVYSAARDIGLTELLAAAIADAADNDPNHDPELRARLLKACGLQEAA